MEGSIGTPDWEACEDCKHADNENGGCKLSDISLSIYLGDWILCDDYEKK